MDSCLRVAAWFTLLRPVHWVKNLFVLAPLLFAQQLFAADLLVSALVAMLLFCMLSSSVYIYNDVQDAGQDRMHPLKARRPIAAGQIQPTLAMIVGMVMAVLALAAAFVLDHRFGLIGLAYLIVNVLYSRWLKRVAFLDAGIIATGFVFRVVGGALAIDVVVSVWLVVCTFCLACLLAFGKRRHELETVVASPSGELNQSRPALAGYSVASLRLVEWILAGITVLSYLLYTIAPGTMEKFHTHNLVFTLPFPVLGILRYLQLVRAKRDKTPTESLVTDIPTLANLACWVAVVILVLYWNS